MQVTSYNTSGVSTVGMQGSVSTNSTRRTSPTRKKNDKVKKKKVKYNPREIRAALMYAHKSQSAGQVLCQAKSKLTNLLKCKGTGQYNESELNSAILHAKRMVRCAHMTTRNLKQEEQLQKRYDKEQAIDEKQHKNNMKLRAKQKEENLKIKEKNEKIQKVQKQKRHVQELMQKRRMHRISERGKMDEADLEYKKNMDRSARGDEFVSEYEIPFIPVEGVELELSEGGLELTEEQIEQQIERMMAVELSTGSGTSDIGGGISTATTSGISMSGGDVPVIDITIGGI